MRKSHRSRWDVVSSWWRHQMETFSALLAICAGNSPVPGEFPTQRPVTRSFDVYFDLRPDKRLRKQSWGWWFETLSHSLWRHRNVIHAPDTCFGRQSPRVFICIRWNSWHLFKRCFMIGLWDISFLSAMGALIGCQISRRKNKFINLTVNWKPSSYGHSVTTVEYLIWDAPIPKP